MSIGAWKTAAIFRRYAIVSSADQRAAMEKLEQSRSKNSAYFGPYSGQTVPHVRQHVARRCSEITQTARVNWCPGTESNRHAPFGARDFKSGLQFLLPFLPQAFALTS